MHITAHKLHISFSLLAVFLSKSNEAAAAFFSQLYLSNKSLKSAATPPRRFKSFSLHPVAETHFFFSNGRMFFNYSLMVHLLLGVGVCSGD